MNGDCNDADANIKPGVVEVCDTIDNDCDGDIDDADSGVVGQSTFYEDADGDGFGVRLDRLCYQPQSYTFIGGDCNGDNSSAGVIQVLPRSVMVWIMIVMVPPMMPTVEL